jgi:hypothetical protein
MHLLLPKGPWPPADWTAYCRLNVLCRLHCTGNTEEPLSMTCFSSPVWVSASSVELRSSSVSLETIVDGRAQCATLWLCQVCPFLAVAKPSSRPVLATHSLISPCQENWGFHDTRQHVVDVDSAQLGGRAAAAIQEPRINRIPKTWRRGLMSTRGATCEYRTSCWRI